LVLHISESIGWACGNALTFVKVNAWETINAGGGISLAFHARSIAILADVIFVCIRTIGTLGDTSSCIEELLVWTG